jgi:hypothetical protein
MGTNYREQVLNTCELNDPGGAGWNKTPVPIGTTIMARQKLRVTGGLFEQLDLGTTYRQDLVELLRSLSTFAYVR